MSKQIQVWHDDNSDVTVPRWCVSLIGDDGQEIRCLSTHEDKTDAIDAGYEAARKRGLRLMCEENGNVPGRELASAEAIQMQAMLLRHGDCYSGNNVEEEAQKWLDEGFTADAADSWCEIGVWDAATAAEFFDADLTPEQVEAAAKSLTEGLDDPADEYTDGDPIYAVCNGDINASIIIEAAE